MDPKGRDTSYWAMTLVISQQSHLCPRTPWRRWQPAWQIIYYYPWFEHAILQGKLILASQPCGSIISRKSRSRSLKTIGASTEALDRSSETNWEDFSLRWYRWQCYARVAGYRNCYRSPIKTRCPKDIRLSHNSLTLNPRSGQNTKSPGILCTCLRCSNSPVPWWVAWTEIALRLTSISLTHEGLCSLNSTLLAIEWSHLPREPFNLNPTYKGERNS